MVFLGEPPILRHTHCCTIAGSVLFLKPIMILLFGKLDSEAYESEINTNQRLGVLKFWVSQLFVGTVHRIRTGGADMKPWIDILQKAQLSPWIDMSSMLLDIFW